MYFNFSFLESALNHWEKIRDFEIAQGTFIGKFMKLESKNYKLI